MIVDLKPKYEFKPMDFCLMKYIGQYNNRGWELCQYAYTEHRVSSSGEQCEFYHSVGGEIYAECIPYTYVRFFCGYAKNRPMIEKKIEGITIGKPKNGLCPDKWLDTEFFIIKFK